MLEFEKQLEADLQTFCMGEFAEQHVINGELVACCLMASEKDNDVNIQNKKGVITSYLSIGIPTLAIEKISPGGVMEVDATLFYVVEYSSSCGMSYIDLSQPIGKFDKSINIQELTTQKVNGIKKEQWQEVYSCEAYIRHISSEEIAQFNTTLNRETLFIKMHYLDTLTSKMRIMYKDKSYNIISINNIEEKNVFLDVICERCD